MAVFPVGSSTSQAEDWVRLSRYWRRGIPAIVGSFDDMRPENAKDAALHNETWVQWTKKRGLSYPAKPFMNMVAMTLGLAADKLNKQGGFDWVLFGDDDTAFNLDVLVDLVKKFDPDEPHLISDNIFVRYNSSVTYHGNQTAPRCVPCGVQAPPVKEHNNWKPPQACPRCTWDMLRESDPDRPEYYSKEGFGTVYLPTHELAVHGGAGMLLSRGLIAELNSTYMHTCLTTQFQRKIVPGGDTIISHCIFRLNVAPTDPGSLALTGKQAFSPNKCQTLCAVSDAYLYTKGFNCCDKECETRLNTIISTHIRTAHFGTPAQARESLRSLARARDWYLYARDAELSGRVTHRLGTWDRDAVCL